METTDKIVLVSKEGEKQIVDSRILDMSEYLKEKRDNHDIHDNTVVLDNIGENTLSRIIAFCRIYELVWFPGNYHIDNPLAEIERPLKSSNMRDIVSEWDANFINISVEDLMDLIVAANFLLIQPLLEVAYVLFFFYNKVVRRWPVWLRESLLRKSVPHLR